MSLNPDSNIWNYFTNIPEEGLAECKFCKQRLKNNRIYSLKLHFNKIHKGMDVINKYYNVNLLGRSAVCKTCKLRLNNRLFYLELHMRKAHNIELKLPEDITVTSTLSPYDEDKIKAVLHVAKRKMIEEEPQVPNIDEKMIEEEPQVPNIDECPTRQIEMKKKITLRSVIRLIAEDVVSPQLISSNHIKAFLSPACEAISDTDAKKFKIDEAETEKVIGLIAARIRNDLSNELHSRLLSIKIDRDLNATDPETFCVSTQYIDNGKIQKRILGVIKVHANDHLEVYHLKQLLYKYNIDSNQIIIAFWDKTKEHYKREVESSQYLKEIELFELYPDIVLGDVKLEPYLGAVAQLCLLDIFKNSKILQKFLECRNMIKFISDESNGYYELFESHNVAIPQLDSPWRAGSTCSMMNDLHAARDILKDATFEKLEDPHDRFNCDNDMWSFIETFCKSTNYVQKTILKFYSTEMHIGDFYGIWLRCKIMTEKLVTAASKTGDLGSTITTEIQKAIKKRTTYLLNQDRIAACLHLDPRFQRVLNYTQKSNAVEYLKRLWYRAKLYIVDNPKSNENSAQSSDSEEDPFLNEFFSCDKQEPSKGSTDIATKIKRLKLCSELVDMDILAYWNLEKNSEHEMYILSNICFAIPATQIYNKVNYSGVYGLEKEMQQSAYTKDNLLTIRLNVDLLDDTIVKLELAGNDYEPECYNISGDDVASARMTDPLILTPSAIAELKEQAKTSVLARSEAQCYNVSDDDTSSSASSTTTDPLNSSPSTIAEVDDKSNASGISGTEEESHYISDDDKTVVSSAVPANEEFIL